MNNCKDIKQILEGQKDQIMALREEFGSDDVDKDAFRTQIEEIEQATLQNILDEEQGAQLTELIERIRQGRREHTKEEGRPQRHPLLRVTTYLTNQLWGV